MEILLGICLGTGLAAACGFRVFVPLLMMGMASYTGHIQLSESFVWIGSVPALIVFGVATVVEIGAYYIPWLDNLMDTLTTPAAVIAGIIVTASCVTDVSPLLKWTLAVVAGGGSAGVVQVGSSLLRATSTATTAGVANPLLSTAEAGGAIGLSLVSVALPVVAALAVIFCIAFVGFMWRKRRIKRRQYAT